MNTKQLILLMALFSTSSATANDVELQFDLAGELALEMEQEIYVSSREEAIAGRKFVMDFAIGDRDVDEEQYAVALKRLRASYNAHGMNQRIPASHLVDTGFSLVESDGVYAANDMTAELDLGPITDGGLVPGMLLAELLPVLPDTPVSSGSTWQSTQNVGALVGWSWAAGDITFDNEVTDIQASSDGTVVTILSRGQSVLSAAPGRAGFIGDGELTRTIEWSVNTNNGRLVSYNLKQESSGTSQLPQGEVPVRQTTTIELRPTE